MAAADIYAQCLLPLKEGYPLYRPGLHFRLNDDVYETYRRKGVSIGDVGIIRPGGDFDFLFNICRPSSSSTGDTPNTSNVVEGNREIELAESSSSASRGSLSTADVSEHPRLSGTVGDSNISRGNLVGSVSVREEDETSERVQSQTPIGSRTAPTGFELIDAGEISTTPNYVSTDSPYLAHGREERMTFNAEASLKPITCAPTFFLSCHTL